MSRTTEEELRALAQDLVKAADSVRDAVLSVGLTQNVTIAALSDLLIEKGLATKDEVDGALMRAFESLSEHDFEDARQALDKLMNLVDRRSRRPN